MGPILARCSIWKQKLFKNIYCFISGMKSGSRPLCATKAENCQRTTVNPEEIKKFSTISSEWWLEYGEFSALRAMNSLRVPFIRDGILSTNAHSLNMSPLPLEGFSILDVGCGGGLLSEPLARIGASVTGLDPSSENIEIAKDHASRDESITGHLTYICGTVEDMCKSEKKYDAVVCSEVVEHVDNPKLFVQCCVDLVKNNGSLFFTTINRTAVSYGAAIIAGEYLLNLLPKGTHSWSKFVTPEEMERILKNCECDIKSVQGMVYNPITMNWSWSLITAVNYALHAVKKTNFK